MIAKIPYLRELGVTAVELLPIFHYVAEPGGNYWGYMSATLFSAHPAYASNRGAAETADEFRELVRALHQADIEVILDVVYNHTAELSADGPTLNFRGIDNSTYYFMAGDPPQYLNDAGTGNVLRVGHPVVRNLVIDSLRFWVKEMHVDGFRFDLAAILTRDADGRIRLDDAPIISAMSADPDFADVRLIAEPWDLASSLRRPRLPRLPPISERQLRQLPRRILPLRSSRVRQQAQPGQRARQPRRQQRQPELELRLGR